MRAIRTGLSGTSPIVTEFEQAIAAHYDVEHVVAVSSGAAAVMTALHGIETRSGQEVIVSPSCPICTVLPMIALGLKPVFCDVRLDSFGLCPHDLESLINERTCAIIETPMWGYPISLDATRTLAGKYELPLILDLAHAHQTRLRDKFLPAYGDISCFSTHECKYISTGEGGFVMAHDSRTAERMRRFTRFGNLEGKEVGLNLKLGGLQASLGLSRIRRLDEITSARLAHRSAILERLANPHIRELPITEDGIPSGYALMLQAVGHDGRELVRYQTAHGIPSDVEKYDNRALFQYSMLSIYKRDCPNAKALLRSITTVPLHPELRAEDIDLISGVLSGYRPKEARRDC
jgi:dTDP-4-amino-4,6-dideoxygalactose transaminase